LLQDFGQAAASLRADAAFLASTEKRMQGYAITFAVGALCSLMFVGSDVQRSVDRVGKIATAVFTLLFVAAEALALFS